MGLRECKKIAKLYDVDIKEVKLETNVKNTSLLNKTLLHTVTPYDVSILIDIDTIILKPFDKIFSLTEKHEFVTTQFCDWTTKFRRIRRRINEWKDIFPEDMKPAYKFGPAVNTGVYGFTKDSKFMANWYEAAVKNVKGFIPDETCCQVILHRYPHKILDCSYNQSCKYGTVTDKTRIIHFHGRKHCRLNEKKEFIYNGNLWWDEYSKIMDRKDIQFYSQFDKNLVNTLNQKGIPCNLQ
jgi:hypothetical protein